MTTTVPIAVAFDQKDVEYLASSFSLKELQQEIHHAEVEASVARQFGEDEEENYWASYVNACRAVLELTKPMPQSQYPRYHGHVDITALKESMDIVAVAEKYTKLQKSGRNFHGLCPVHIETKPSFYVYPEERRWHCYGACATGGDAIALVMAVEKVGFREAVATLDGQR